MKKLLFGLLFLFGGFAQAAPLTPDIANSVYQIAYGFCPTIRTMENGCPPEWLRNPPSLTVDSQEELCSIVNERPNCSLLGLYFGGNMHVTSRLDFNSFMGHSVLLHEFIHHFQWLRNKGYGASNCTEWLADEKEAYLAQIDFLEKTNAVSEANRVRWGLQYLQCPYDLMQKNEESYPVIMAGINEKLLLCQELDYDLRVIAIAVQNKTPKEEVIGWVDASTKQLRPDRMENIRKLIEEAYAQEGNIWDWVEFKLKDCRG